MRSHSGKAKERKSNDAELWGRGQWEGTETLRHNTQFKHPLFFRERLGVSE